MNISSQDYIHREGVCHRDLKPENLLLDSAGTLKITDFGLSVVFKRKETGDTRLLSGLCGSWPYIAPEVGHHGTFLNCTHDRTPGYLGEAV